MAGQQAARASLNLVDPENRIPEVPRDLIEGGIGGAVGELAGRSIQAGAQEVIEGGTLSAGMAAAGVAAGEATAASILAPAAVGAGVGFVVQKQIDKGLTGALRSAGVDEGIAGGTGATAGGAAGGFAGAAASAVTLSAITGAELGGILGPLGLAMGTGIGALLGLGGFLIGRAMNGGRGEMNNPNDHPVEQFGYLPEIQFGNPQVSFLTMMYVSVRLRRYLTTKKGLPSVAARKWRCGQCRKPNGVPRRDGCAERGERESAAASSRRTCWWRTCWRRPSRRS